MTSNDITTTRYGVARKQKLVGDSYATVGEARQQLAHVTETMQSIGLTPDVHLAEVDVTTTVSAPRAYKEPEPEASEPEQTGETGDGEQ